MLEVESLDDPPLGSFVFETVGDNVTIGRDAVKCGICVGAKAAGVSKLHIKLTLEIDPETESPYLITEENNTYGTVFNGERCKVAQVRAGDKFRVGKCDFHVKSLIDEDQTPPPEELEEIDDAAEPVEELPKAGGTKRRREDSEIGKEKRSKAEVTSQDQSRRDEVDASQCRQEEAARNEPSQIRQESPPQMDVSSQSRPKLPSALGESSQSRQKPSIFGGSSQSRQKPSIFGGSSQSRQKPSIFGGSSQSRQVKASGRASSQSKQKSFVAGDLSQSKHADVIDLSHDNDMFMSIRSDVGSQLQNRSRNDSQAKIPSKKAKGMDIRHFLNSSQQTVSSLSQSSSNVLAPDSVQLRPSQRLRDFPQRGAGSQEGLDEDSLFGSVTVDFCRDRTDDGAILAPDSPEPNSPVAEEPDFANCRENDDEPMEVSSAVPDSQPMISRRDSDGFAVPDLPTTKGAKRKQTPKKTPPKRVKLEEPTDDARPATRRLSFTQKTEVDAQPDLNMGLDDERIKEIHAKSVSVVSLCRALNHTTLTSPASSSRSSAKDGKPNFKRFRKAAQGAYRHLSAELRSPVGFVPNSDPNSSRTFVNVG